MASKDTTGPLPGQKVQKADADRDAYIAENMYVSQPAPGSVAKKGQEILSPPYGDLPRKLRGRQELVDQLSDLLTKPDDRAHALVGLGGTGKSAVALQLARLARDQGKPAWWVEAASIKASMLWLARALGAEAGMLADAKVGEEDPADVLWQALAEHDDGWLLVINNADEAGALTVMGRQVRHGDGWVRGSASGLVMVTTRLRDPNLWGHSVELHYVNWLTDEAGAEVLCDLAPHAGTSTEAIELSKRLGGLPLALHQAGSYIANSLDPVTRTFAGYHHELATRFPELMKPAYEPTDRELVTSTWELSLDQLAESGRLAARPLLEVLSCFAGGIPIPTDRLDLTALTPNHCQADASELWRSANDLKTVGLLEIRQAATDTHNDQYWVVHPLVAETTQLRLATRAGPRTDIATAIQLLVRSTVRLDPAAPSDWHTWQDWLPHASSLATSNTLAITTGQLAELKAVLDQISRATAQAEARNTTQTAPTAAAQPGEGSSAESG
jgi:hypothetical protein